MFYLLVDGAGRYSGIFSTIDLLIYLSNLTSRDILLAQRLQTAIVKERLSFSLKRTTVRGCSRFMQGTVISDAVNLASRLEQLTKTYNVSLIVSAEVMRELEDPNRYRYRFLDRVRPKGKMESVAIYEVFDADTAAVAEGKLRIRNEFERAAFECHAGRFAAAKDVLEGIVARGEKDTPTEIYLERCTRSVELGLHAPPMVSVEGEGS